MDRFVGKNLRKARETAGLSQAALARAVGLSAEYVSLLEGEKRTPSFAALRKIAIGLQRDIAFFFQEGPAAPDPFDRLVQDDAVDARGRDELQKFRRYCEDYLRLEALAGRRLELAPLYPPDVPADRLADEERRRLGLGDEPVRDVFALFETNGLRFLRLAMPSETRVSGAFLFLEVKEAAFALVNAAQPLGRQVFSAAHEYCHYLRDRAGGPIVESADVFIDDYVGLYHPREPFAQAFAARFLVPPGRIRGFIDKNFGSQRLSFDHILALKRYFGVGAPAILRAMRELGLLSRARFEDYGRMAEVPREKELFGPAGDEASASRRFNPSDRFRLLKIEAAKKIASGKTSARPVQKSLPSAED